MIETYIWGKFLSPLFWGILLLLIEDDKKIRKLCVKFLIFYGIFVLVYAIFYNKETENKVSSDITQTSFKFNTEYDHERLDRIIQNPNKF